MESCATLIGVLQEYAEGETSPEASLHVLGHLHACAACRRRVAAHKDLFRMLDDLPRVALPPDFRFSVMTRVLEAPLPSEGLGRRHLRRIPAFIGFAAAAASVGAGTAGAYFVSRYRWGGWSIMDPETSARWITGLGRIAYSFLLDVVTRTTVPALLPSTHGPSGWGLGVVAFVLAACAVGALGLGILATARALSSHPGR